MLPIATEEDLVAKAAGPLFRSHPECPGLGSPNGLTQDGTGFTKFSPPKSAQQCAHRCEKGLVYPVQERSCSLVPFP